MEWLYADDLVAQCTIWKNGMEIKGLAKNVENLGRQFTKVMRCQLRILENIICRKGVCQ